MKIGRSSVTIMLWLSAVGKLKGQSLAYAALDQLKQVWPLEGYGVFFFPLPLCILFEKCFSVFNRHLSKSVFPVKHADFPARQSCQVISHVWFFRDRMGNNDREREILPRLLHFWLNFCPGSFHHLMCARLL